MELKLPRSIENDSRRAAVETALARDLKPLWPGGTLLVPHLAFTPALVSALKMAKLNKQVERGLEQIEKILLNEERGLSALRDRQGTQPARRVSRLLLMADGGAERFYRTCETVLKLHADRVLGIRLTIASENFAESLFGADETAKALLVSERDGVANVLLALQA